MFVLVRSSCPSIFHGTTACDHQILRQSRAAPRQRPIAYPIWILVFLWYFTIPVVMWPSPEPLKREHRSSSHGSCGWIALFLFTGLRTFMHFLLVKQYVVAEFRYHPISFFVGYQFLPVVNPPCFPSSRRVEVPRPVQLGSLKSENEGQDWKILWRGDWQWLHEILGALFCMFSSRSKHIKTMGDCGCFKHTEKTIHGVKFEKMFWCK